MSPTPPRLDVSGNRSSQKWSRKELLGRLLWALLQPAWRFSPRPAWGWRRGMLRLFGGRVGAQAHIYPTVRITIPWNIEIDAEAAVGDYAILYALGPIRIGPRATVSQYVHLCAGTHDITRPDRPLVKLPIEIGAEAWVAADAFVGPGVTIGPRAVLGARAVAMASIEADCVAVGNPVKIIRKALL